MHSLTYMSAHAWKCTWVNHIINLFFLCFQIRCINEDNTEPNNELYLKWFHRNGVSQSFVCMLLLRFNFKISCQYRLLDLDARLHQWNFSINLGLFLFVFICRLVCFVLCVYSHTCMHIQIHLYLHEHIVRWND